MPETTPGSLPPRRCTECGAENPATRSVCWLCGAQLASQQPPAVEENFYVSPTVVPEEEWGASGPASSWPLLITLAVVCLGIVSIAPGLAILLVILVLPALVRTSNILGRRKQRGVTVSRPEQVWLFLSSLGIVIVIGVAAYVTFLAVCFGGGWGLITLLERAVQGENLMLIFVAAVIGLIAGVAAAIFIVVVLGRRLWPSRNGKNEPKPEP